MALPILRITPKYLVVVQLQQDKHVQWYIKLRPKAPGYFRQASIYRQVITWLRQAAISMRIALWLKQTTIFMKNKIPSQQH